MVDAMLDSSLMEKERLRNLKVLLERDMRNLQILQSDRELDVPIKYVPDCYDIIQFIHIEDPLIKQSGAYLEGVRRYFVSSEKLLLIPAWVYEFTNYIRHVIIDNIAAYSSDKGFEQFLKDYPIALEFLELWNTGKYDEARALYSEKETWTQVLGFTDQQVVENLLGNPIRRFNYLVSSQKLVPITHFYNSGNRVDYDGSTYAAALDFLNRKRSKPTETKKNEIDARSLAMVSAINKRQGDRFFTAVTASKRPLLAFYEAIDETRNAEGTPFSLARSSVSTMIRNNVRSAAEGEVDSYLNQGINLAATLIEKLSEVSKLAPDFIYESSAVPTDELIRLYGLKGEIGKLFELYTYSYRNKVFRPIEALGLSKSRNIALGVEQTKKVLDRNTFIDSMNEAKRQLQERAKELLGITSSIVATDSELVIKGRTLNELFDELIKDFNTNVF